MSSRRSSGISAGVAGRASVVAVAQKLLPAKAAIDVPLALAIIGLGVLILIAPSLVPGLTPPMM